MEHRRRDCCHITRDILGVLGAAENELPLERAGELERVVRVRRRHADDARVDGPTVS